MFKKALAGWPHVLRVLAMALAALALAWGIAGTEALLAAMVGAGLGVVSGELLSRTRVKLPVLLASAALVLLLALLGSSLAAATETLPRMIGPGTTLRVTGVLRFGALALTTACALRAIAARKKTAVALEAGFLVVAITTVFAAHRDGVIARPLWLSDWAWQEGIDPAQILLGVGCVAVGLLAILLLAEQKSGRSVSSLMLLAALATLAMLCVSVIGVPKPDPLADLGLKVSGDGEPPPPPPPDAGPGDPQKVDGGGQPDASQDGGGKPDAGDAGQDGGEADGGKDGGGRDTSLDGGEDASGLTDAATDAGEGQSDASLDDASIANQPTPQERPQDSSQQQLDQSEGERGAAAPVAVVLLDDDYSPPSQAYYFREDALSQFNGSRLVAGTRSDVDMDILPSHPTEPTEVRDAPPAKGRTRVHATVAMLTEHNRPFGLETPTSFAPAPNPNRQRFVRAYRFEALAQSIEYRKLFGRTAGNAAWTPDVLAYYTQAPTDPRYAELAKKIVAKLPPARQKDPFAMALAVKIHLDHELTYSTNARHTGASDPAAEMLFGDKIGYCVHFAHSAVYLWRSLGIPARVGVGYRSEEDNRKGGSTILIRSGDAHAWPELYLDGLGWIILDISAAKNLDPPGQPPDDDLQRLLGEMARNQPPDPTEQPTKKKLKPYQHFGRDIGIAGLLLLAAIVTILYLVKIWRRLRPRLVGAYGMPRVGYRAALDVLAEAGLSREYGETREGFAQRIKAVSPSFEKLTSMHLAAWFRSPDLELGARPELAKGTWKETLSAVKREVGRGAKLWRRVLGMLNPASFLDSK